MLKLPELICSSDYRHITYCEKYKESKIEKCACILPAMAGWLLFLLFFTLALQELLGVCIDFVVLLPCGGCTGWQPFLMQILFFCN